MTLKQLLNPEVDDEAEALGWSLAEKFYASVGSPRDKAALATFLQRAINTLQRKHIRYPRVFVKRRAQLLGKAVDGSTWEPGAIENPPIEISEPGAPVRTEAQIIEYARRTYSPEEFERWQRARGLTAEPQKNQVLEMRRKRG